MWGGISGLQTNPSLEGGIPRNPNGENKDTINSW